jgi:hypothetical protein
MIRFYFHPTPNPAKIALFLEEAGLPYEAIPVDTSKGEQHAASFRAINPNGKVPAIVDTDGPGGKEVRVFDSTAILIYLAEKTDRSCCPGCCSWPRASARSPGKRSTSSSRRRKASTTPSTAIAVRPIATIKSSTITWKAGPISWARPIRSRISRPGAGSIAPLSCARARKIRLAHTRT